MYKQCNQLAIEWNLILLACCGKDQLHSNQMTPTDLTRQRNEFLLILKLNCWNLKIIIQWTNITFVSLMPALQAYLLQTIDTLILTPSLMMT